LKKYSIQIFLILLLAFLLGGCNSLPVETSTPSANPSVTKTPTESTMLTETAMPQYSATPETTLPPGARIPAEGEAIDFREEFKNMNTENGEWLYYADWNRMFYFKDDYECPINRVKKDGSEDMDLGITGFMFTIVDKYVFVGKNHTFGDFGHWDTVRMELDGANKKDIPYPDMNIKVFGDRIYFDAWNESVLYAADSASEQVKKYNIEVPDQQALKDKLKNISPVYILNIHDVLDDWIYFHYNLLDTDGMPFYEGDYKVNLEGTKVEKTNAGTFNENQIGYYNE
jgi:hypothetical protein